MVREMSASSAQAAFVVSVSLSYGPVSMSVVVAVAVWCRVVSCDGRCTTRSRRSSRCTVPLKGNAQTKEQGLQRRAVRIVLSKVLLLYLRQPTVFLFLFWSDTRTNAGASATTLHNILGSSLVPTNHPKIQSIKPA